MKLHPLIYVAILGTGLLLAVVIYVARGGEQASSGAGGPVPVAASDPPDAPAISEPPLVAVPDLPARPRRSPTPPTPKPTPTRVAPPPAAAPPAAVPEPAPQRKRKPRPQRGRLKQAPLQPPLVAPPR